MSVKNVAASQCVACLQVLEQSLEELVDVKFYKLKYQLHRLRDGNFTITTPSTVLLGNIQSTEIFHLILYIYYKNYILPVAFIDGGGPKQYLI